MKAPRVTLEQWRTLQAVIDHGGFAQAAAALHRSQSSVSYTLQQMQQRLGTPLLKIDGRKAQLTDSGAVLLRRAKRLLHEAAELDLLAARLDEGWESEINLVVDIAFPTALLIDALQEFAPHSQATRIQLREVALSGVDEALNSGNCHLAIGTSVPQGFLGNILHEVEFIAVAHPDHALHQKHAELTMSDLEHEMQVVIRDSGLQQRDSGWLGAEQRWTVSGFATAVTLIGNGLGFGWLPDHQVVDKINQGTLKPLPLKEGQRRRATLYIIFGHAELEGPATRRLAECFYHAVR